MKNEINNTSKSVLQPDEQSSDDKSSLSTAQDNTALIRRRSLLKGLGAAPLVVTLHSGAAMAASSTGGCVGTQTTDVLLNGCRANDGTDHDSFLRVEVGPSGRPVNPNFNYDTPGGKHPYWDDSSQESRDRKWCLVSVDAEGKTMDYNSVDPLQLTSNSCWTSFV